MTFTVTDENGHELKVGQRVHANGHMATIIQITEPDADYDDDLGRAVGYNPDVTVAFRSLEETDGYGTVYDWRAAAGGPGDEPTFICGDVEWAEDPD